MTRPRARNNSLRTVFAWPLALFIIGLAGLVIALTGDGWRDSASWLALASPVAVFCWAMRARQS